MASASQTANQNRRVTGGDPLRSVMPSLDIDHSSQLVWQSARTYDLDRYLAALRFPYEHRDAMMAVISFYGEINRIPEAVNEPMMGQIRLQWWRDVLSDQGLSSRTGNPIADALCEAVISHNLPTGLLLGMIDAQEFHLSTVRMPDQPALRQYLIKTDGALFQLGLRILLDQRPSLSANLSLADELCFHAGEAFARARILAKLPQHLASMPGLIPDDTRTHFQSAPKEAVKEEADRITELMSKIRSGCARLPGGLRPLVARSLLPTRLVPAYLQASTRASHDPLSNMAEINPLGRVWTIWRHSFSRSI